MKNEYVTGQRQGEKTLNVPDDAKDTKLLRHTSVMFSASMVCLLFAYFYQVYMARTLGPVEYGVLGSLVAIFYILNVPLGTVGLVITKFVSVYNSNEAYGSINALILGLAKKLLVFGLLLFLLVSIISPLISSFLQIQRILPVILFGMAVFFYVLLPVTRGVLQGTQRFVHLALNTIFEKVSLLVIGILLVSIGFGVNGAILAWGLAGLSTLLLSFIPLRFLYGKGRGNTNNRDIYMYSLPVFATVACITTISSIDLIAVKHFFAPEQAGHYNAIAVIGKVVFYLSLSLSRVLFPKASELLILNKPHVQILKKSMLYMACVSAVAIVGSFLFPTWIISLFFGSKYLPAAYLLPLYVVAMSILSISVILTYYNLSVMKKAKFIVPLVSCTVLEIVLLTFFHSSLSQVIYVILLSFLLMLIANIILNIRTDLNIR